MLQPTEAQHVAEAAQHAGEAAASGKFNAGETIIGHVANSSHEHPLIHLPTWMGIDFSVTKHVFMLWVVALVLFVVITLMVRRYVRASADRLVPSGSMNARPSSSSFAMPSCSRMSARSGCGRGRRCC